MTLGPFWVSFLLKILVTAAVVIAAARTAERAGPFFGALIACLPVSAGPSYVLLSLQASYGLIAERALASAAVSGGAALFLAVYVVLGPRAGAAATLGSALGAWLVAAILIRQFQWTAPAVAALNAVAYGLAFLVIPRLEHSHPISPPDRPWFHLPVLAARVGFLGPGVRGLTPALRPAHP